MLRDRGTTTERKHNLMSDTNDNTNGAASRDSSLASGSHPRVDAEIKSWLAETKNLCFGTDAEKADSWQKCASRMERLARELETEISANTEAR